MTYDHWKTTEPDPGEGFEPPMPPAPTPADAELYARVQLEAARKNMDQCQEREKIAFDAYVEAMLATQNAWKRNYHARQAWHKAARAAEEE